MSRKEIVSICNSGYFIELLRIVIGTILVFSMVFFHACNSKQGIEGSWDFEIFFDEEPILGTLKLEKENDSIVGVIHSFIMGKMELENLKIVNDELNANFEKWGMKFFLNGTFESSEFSGTLVVEDDELIFTATKQSFEPIIIDRSNIKYMLSDNDLQETELNIDHAGIIEELDEVALERGSRIYNANCINCHGNPDMEGSLPNAAKFWKHTFKAGNDPFSMYQTITRGYGAMAPQLRLTPQEKYDVITYIREEYIRDENRDQYFKTTPGYLANLPKGTSRGPASEPYNPWSDQDYGNFFINTYELSDEETGLERYHSPGPTPFADEDYLKNNFAYKGIAVRLDQGDGGISSGKAWMIFDHDVMRVAGGWTGSGFIDWEGILLNDRHETYPRTVGKLHFETPVGPGWANPNTGSFDDSRYTARDGRKFGPLPKKWANYKGLYHHGDNIIFSYTVGSAEILEQLGMEEKDDQIVFTRTINITPSSSFLKLKIASAANNVNIFGSGASLSEEDGYVMMNVKKFQEVRVKLFIADSEVKNFDRIVKASPAPESLLKYTKGGPAHYPQELESRIVRGSNDGLLAVDHLSPPFENPWQARMKLSGIDFMEDGNRAVACTTDGDIFLITGLTNGGSTLKWKRIGSGLFQPLGIKVLDEKIYVTCRDQLVLLRDLNGDDETDYYESFNHDHQVTDHFHEFAMGLQVDKEGNFYYAKSGRHAREALVPQHGTLIKVSKDGKKSEIIASGFRAANGICLNPDGSFLVTDQQGYWNPMNRINWIDTGGENKFFGNMWGYNPPADSGDLAMVPPMVWVDMEFDRSPSELLWIDSEKWGPLNGGLLSFSYGYGKMQLVLHEEVNGQRQGGIVDVPQLQFYTGVMRGRFHPEDGNLYLCGMSAWSTSKNMRTGDLYRIRYTGNPVTVPIKLNAEEDGIQLSFASELDAEKVANPENFEVQTWDIIRSSDYGSERYNTKILNITKVEVSKDKKSVKLVLPDIKPIDVMTIAYKVMDLNGNVFEGKVQNTIHNLAGSSSKELAILTQ